MSGQIIFFVLGAALLHASWNIIVKGGVNKLYESAMNPAASKPCDSLTTAMVTR